MPCSSVFQELGDEKADGVPVGSAGEGGRRLVPGELGTEPLEEAQPLGRQAGSQHALCPDVRLLQTTACVFGEVSEHPSPYL